MELTIGQLRALLSSGIEEAKVGASAGYMKKEALRAELQKVVAAAVEAGGVSDQRGLDQLWSDLDMALKALKVVPLEVWQKIAKQ